MFFKPKCSCGSKAVVHTNNLPTMHGNVKLHYCNDCHSKRLREEKEQMERNNLENRIAEQEYIKQQRYEYLKREIELKELERKAKELGID